MQAFSVEQWRVAVPVMMSELMENYHLFEKLYNFAYLFSLEPEQESLEISMAIKLWNIRRFYLKKWF